MSKNIELSRDRRRELLGSAIMRIKDVVDRQPYNGSFVQFLVGDGIRGIRQRKYTKTQLRNMRLDFEFNQQRLSRMTELLVH